VRRPVGNRATERQYRADDASRLTHRAKEGGMNDVVWFVGIDWGSERHAVCVVDATGHRREERPVVHTADAVQACLDWI
jgi:hypothetical protein